MESTTCQNCGCTEFIKQSGYYICNNCDTQSQEIQVQSFDFGNAGTGPCEDDDDEKEVVRTESTKIERLPTSWECYNIVLKGLVEQLMNLGASPRLKVTTFQLWALYLKEAKVAFTSTTIEKLPALPLGFKIRDAKILYGIPNLRKKLFKDFWGHRKCDQKRKLDSDDSSSLSATSSPSTLRSMRRKQRKIALSEVAETSSTSIGTVLSNTETLDSVAKEMESRLQKMKSVLFKKSTKKALLDIMGRVKKLEKNKTDVQMKQTLKNTMRREIYEARRCSKKNGTRSHNMLVNTVLLISIIRVALLLLKDDIMLGDILRWICEGRLSVHQPEKFVPKFYSYVKKNDFINVNRRGLQLDIKNFTSNINLPHIPTPNLFKLLKRYCDELSLPAEFFTLALNIMSDKCPQMDYSKFTLSFPDYECRVMAYILFTFKLLFSLDDFTEYHLDKFAEAVNERRKSVLEGDIPELFSWTKWVKYIECRKAVLAKYDVSVNQLAYNGRVDNEEVFHSYWERMKPTHKVVRKVINSNFLTTLQNDIRKLRLEHEDRSMANIDFPVSLIPSVTGIEYLFRTRPELMRKRSRKILSYDFSSCSVIHGINFELCENIAEMAELNVELSEDYAKSKVRLYESPEKKLLAFSKTSLPPIYFPVDVKIENDLELIENENTEEYVSKIFKPKVINIQTSETYDSNAVKENPDVSYKIYDPSKRYWLFQEFYRRISDEEFDDLIAENLPTSFLWLLKECASILRVDSKQLYLELIVIETVLCCKYVDNQYDKKNVPLQIREQEW